MDNSKYLSVKALKRMPVYMAHLKSLEDETEYISSPAIAKALGLNDVQVRKDLAVVSTARGTPKKGFLVKDLIKGIADFLGCNKTNEAILAGYGKLGHALMSYRGFEEYGIKILAAFDSNKALVDNKRIFDISKLPDLLNKLNVQIGIITVPEEYAQQVCDIMVENGVLAIWNFAPVHLKVPDNILVQNENMASSLAVLSKHLSQVVENNI